MNTPVFIYDTVSGSTKLIFKNFERIRRSSIFIQATENLYMRVNLPYPQDGMPIGFGFYIQHSHGSSPEAYLIDDAQVDRIKTRLFISQLTNNKLKYQCKSPWKKCMRFIQIKSRFIA